MMGVVKISSAECNRVLGHCWAYSDPEDDPTDEASFPQECRHCDATRRKEWTKPITAGEAASREAKAD